ncbi:uncharacterized protein BDW70DRAFT_59371 [Aspergillus foveolatus]|uniref:uncharacterized protein n=1 Tax=Aspergillus foveolatus TaxID=210207 RepID=UPI003CCE14F2
MVVPDSQASSRPGAASHRLVDGRIPLHQIMLYSSLSLIFSFFAFQPGPPRPLSISLLSFCCPILSLVLRMVGMVAGWPCGFFNCSCRPPDCRLPRGSVPTVPTRRSPLPPCRDTNTTAKISRPLPLALER